MAKHKDDQLLADVNNLRESMRTRWQCLLENGCAGEQYEGEFRFLEAALSDEVVMDDDFDVYAMDCDQVSLNFATKELVVAGVEQGSGAGAAQADPVSAFCSPDLLIGGIPSTESPNLPPDQVLQAGSFDGGMKVGFYGSALNFCWDDTLSALEGAKKLAAEGVEGCGSRGIEGVPVVLGGEEVVVFPTGGKSEGLIYKYRFMVRGVEFLIHSNPQGDIQPVRIRYTAEALIGNNLYALHNEFVLPFVAKLGFGVSEEKISRADFQVILDVPVVQFYKLIFDGHCVTKFRKFGMHGTLCGVSRVGVSTLTLGSRDKVQICIYDKRRELRDNITGLIKEQLFVENCCGYDWYNSDRPITRVEFRLGREALKQFGVNSLEDLRLRERAIVDELTSNWFRLLEKPKVRGHENGAKLHEVWERVRLLFFRYFSGAEVTDVKWNSKKSVSCTDLHLTYYSNFNFACLQNPFRRTLS